MPGIQENSASSIMERKLLNGELREAAKQCRSEADLAKLIGVTPEAYSIAKRRLRKRGVIIPELEQLKYGDAAINISNAIPAAPLDEEKTDPHFVVPTIEMTVDDNLIERRYKAQLSSLANQLDDALIEIEELRKHQLVSNEAIAGRSIIEPITIREKTSGKREATAVALASDWHIEEHVDPARVNGVNKYDLDISKRRAERFFEGVAYLVNYHRERFLIRDMVLWLGGDLITGYLRDENLQNNLLSPSQAIATLHTWIEPGIKHILDRTELESLRVVCNSGNHGRLTEKMTYSTREANSIEWLLYVGLKRELEKDSRITFELPQGLHTYIQIYEWMYRFCHGDEVNYQGGVGGIMIPITKAIMRWDTVIPAAVTNMGHFHSYHNLPHLVVNSSLIGYNEYALGKGMRYEEPAQAFYLVDSKRGKCMPTDIWVDSLMRGKLIT
jgi:hypothetical protein